MSTELIVTLISRPQASCRLLVLPYAGANANHFVSWNGFLSPDIELLAVELPGRGSRFGQAPLTEVEQIVAQIAAQLPRFDDKPLVLFGHSMGAMLAYELCQYLRANNQPLPSKLILSARTPPQLEIDCLLVPDEDDEIFTQQLLELGGTPAELLANESFLKMILPILRLDFSLLANYCPSTLTPLPMPLYSYAANKDQSVSPQSVANWHQLAAGNYIERTFHGSHFYIHESLPVFINRLNEDVLGTIN